MNRDTDRREKKGGICYINPRVLLVYQPRKRGVYPQATAREFYTTNYTVPTVTMKLAIAALFVTMAACVALPSVRKLYLYITFHMRPDRVNEMNTSRRPMVPALCWTKMRRRVTLVRNTDLWSMRLSVLSTAF